MKVVKFPRGYIGSEIYEQVINERDEPILIKKKEPEPQIPE